MCVFPLVVAEIAMREDRSLKMKIVVSAYVGRQMTADHEPNLVTRITNQTGLIKRFIVTLGRVCRLLFVRVCDV